jgi:hypothetical protein
VRLASSSISKKNRYEFLREIAASPIDSAQLPLRVHISVPTKAAAGTILPTVYVPPQSLATLLAPKADGRTAAHFEVMFMQIGAKHKLLDATQKQVDGELTPRESTTSKGGWTLPVRLPIKPRARLLCVILHDEASEAVGSIHIPLAGPESALNIR